MTDDLPLFTTYPTQAGIGYTYTDLTPHVPVPASRARAAKLDSTGEFRRWAEQVLATLDGYGPDGATWQELGATLGLHHGQISGRLSKMHEHGLVFALQTTRNHCHPYVHWKYRDRYPADARRDEPVKTRSGRMADLVRRAQAAADLIRTLTPGTPAYAAAVEELLAVLAENQ